MRIRDKKKRIRNKNKQVRERERIVIFFFTLDSLRRLTWNKKQKRKLNLAIRLYKKKYINSLNEKVYDGLLKNKILSLFSNDIKFSVKLL